MMKCYQTTLFIFIFQSFCLTAQFSDRVVIYNGDSEAYEVYAEDINNDGLNDIIGCTKNSLILFINRGNHVYDNLVLDNMFNSIFFTVHAADFDDDGLIDIVSSAEGTGDISWYKNMGNDIFSSKKLIDCGSHSRDVITADIDNDGDMDVLANIKEPFSDEDLVVYYKNDGTGIFGDKIILSNVSNGVQCIIPFDIDEDGDLDVFSTDLINDKVWMMENLGDGLFDDVKSIAEDLNGPTSMTIADFDNDGRYDFAVAINSSASKISTFTYNNDGTFSAPERIFFIITNSQINSVYFKDLDQDDKVDLCFADNNTGTIGYLKNLGTSFDEDESIVYSNATRASCVFAEDLDGDLDSEVLYTLKDGKEIGYYINSISTSSSHNEILDPIKIFPNPAISFIKIDLDVSSLKQLLILEVNGSIQFNDNNPRSNIIDLKNLLPGSYVLQVKTSEGIYTKQFIKE